jgi:predicted Zn-dependent peptidase
LHQKSVLDNGIRVITETMPHTQTVSICIFIGVGSRYETNEIAGISHFIEHMVFRGTHKRSTSREISEVIEGVGGILNGGTDREPTLTFRWPWICWLTCCSTPDLNLRT